VKQESETRERRGCTIFSIYYFYNGLHIRHCDRESDMERSMKLSVSEIVVGSRRRRAAIILKELLQ